jgi:hypothetical protein
MRLLKSLAILCAASTWVGNTAHAQAINNDSAKEALLTTRVLLAKLQLVRSFCRPD